MNFARQLRKLWNIRMILTVFGALRTLPREIRKVAERIGNRSTYRDHPNYSIINIGQNTKKSPGDLKRLAVTQTPVKEHQLTLV